MKKLVAVLLAIMTVISLMSGCGKDKEDEQKPQLVKTQQVGQKDLNVEGTYTGTVRGRYETNMSFQVGGRIMNRNVQVGDRVNSGDILMSIDPRDVVQQSNQGDAQVAAAKAQLDLAQSNLSRYQQLYAQEAIPAMVLDQYQTAYNSALAQYNQAVAGAETGHNALGYTALVAPASGVISSITAEAGQVVGAGQTVLTLVQSNELEVEINVPENRLEDAQLGKSVQVSFWALKGVNVSGTVREISPMADPVSRTYRVRISIPNPPSGMQLGMTASVKCQESAGSHNDGLVLPLSAIYQINDTSQVWVVDKSTDTVSLKDIKFEKIGDNSVRVMGLNVGDIVVIAGVHKLRQGQQVRLMEDQ
ncbi:RND efflux membrane fusion protein [Anaerovibrio sp. JC8]|uniref:efflux RND transporter periplasmic adaptor subunit n=1 Tax=Anaerovibrio sp. JC8 TaxID=1240085 RepID=UPI000A0E9A8C|nr:efflux RND transporter periplasmic adaptor subunit [Anaerovibrio sp. JC8]ORT98881.1 RND efflux membrane fusion protein [Anaerovibrio sp. JC8]